MKTVWTYMVLMAVVFSATAAFAKEASDQAAPKTAPAAPAVDKPAWASEFGNDQYGTWADLKVDGVAQRFRWIQPGTFTMGATKAEHDAFLATCSEWILPSGEAQHQVTLTQGFWLADSECTQALWQAITGTNPASKDRRIAGPQNPVFSVSWTDVQKFLSTLNGRVSGGNFRLPSEAQWEYACRAGTTTAFSFGTTITPEQVNYDGTRPFDGVGKHLYRYMATPVKSLPPNAWGLYDMHGNASEWVNDIYELFSGSAERDPTGGSYGTIRVIRGGSWSNAAGTCRSAHRKNNGPDETSSRLGFRIAAQATP